MMDSESMKKVYSSEEHYFGENGSVCVKCGHSISECRDKSLKCRKVIL